MPRAFWRGSISFGLVTIPVRLYLATEDRRVSFHLLCPNDKSRIRNKRWCPEEDREIAWNEVIRGYEVGKEEYVEITDADLENLPLPTAHTVEILEFCDAGEIDDVYLQRAYYLEPEKLGARPYSLLKAALEKTDRVAVGKVAFRDREHLVRVSSQDGGLRLHTLHWPDEIRDEGELDVPDGAAALQPRELEMAVMLVDNLTEPFDPARFSDEYRAAIEAVVAEKLGKGIVTREPAAPQPAMDLMAALKASVEASKEKTATVARTSGPTPETHSVDAPTPKVKQPSALAARRKVAGAREKRR